MKHLIWTALVASLTATAASFAFRFATWLWQTLRQEEPPEMRWWGRMLVGKPLRKSTLGRLAAGTVTEL